jgi:diguanylate cyclase
MPFWIGLILIVQCGLLGVVGWYVYRTQCSLATAAPPADSNEGRTVRVHKLLDDAGAALADHAELLKAFEESLGGAVKVADPDSLSQQCQQVRRANRQVDETVDATLDGLAQACGDLLSSERNNLKGYQRRTGQLDTMLEEVDREAKLAGLAGKLLDMVHELRDENKAIRTDLVAAKDATIELMIRAYAAEHSARVDPLTQLPNRRAFDEFHAQCEAGQARKGEPFSLVMFDIDHFKNVNDQFGHAAGDAVLSMIGRIFKNNRRTGDHISRMGGEEFAMLLPGCEAESARMVAERYRQKIEAASLRYREDELSVTVSCGVAEAVVGQSRRCLLERADAALYAAKSAGRNTTCVDPVEVDADGPSPVVTSGSTSNG